MYDRTQDYVAAIDAPDPYFKPTQSLAVQMMERGARDPCWWFEHALGATPWPKQAAIANALVDHRIVATKSCHGVGKSWFSGRGCLWYLCTHVPSIVITTAPGERQVKGILWKEIRTAYSRARIPIGGELLKLQLNMDEDWFMWGFTAPEYDPDKFMGFHCENILVAVDEACGVAQEIFDGGVAALMSNAGAKLLMTGNPTDPNGYFYQTFDKPPPNTALFKIDAFDTPNFYTFGLTLKDFASDEWIRKIDGRPLPMPGLIAPDWVAERYNDWGPDDPRFLARVLAEFPHEGEKNVFRMSWVDGAMEPGQHVRPGKRRLGVDPASFGTNECVVAYKNGNFCKILGGRMGLNTIETAGWVKELGTKYAVVEAAVDTIGVGQGVVDQLKAWKNYGTIPFDVIPINGANRPSDTEQFLNRRAEIYWHVRRQTESGDLKIQKDEELRKQMVDIRWDFSNGKIKIESKEDYKKRNQGESPDRLDAIVYACSDDAPRKKTALVF